VSKWQTLDNIVGYLVVCAVLVTLTISVSSCLAKISDNNTRCEATK
jgi:hypothetical protein